jgi:glutathione S-transferase
MSFSYISVEDAIPRAGLRMVVLSKVPSPWGEAAKGIFHVKGLDFAAVRLVYDNDALKAWAGQRSGPVVVYENEPPRSGWAEILMLAERLAPTPALLSLEPAARGKAIELANLFCGERGLGWTRRLQLAHAGLAKSGGFSERVAGYLGQKYGYHPEETASYGPRVRELLGQVSAALRAAGGEYYHGATFGAVDIYSAAFMALFAPLPEAQCAMDPGVRAAFEWLDEETRMALDPALIEHRDRMYARHLELPLAL